MTSIVLTLNPASAASASIRPATCTTAQQHSTGPSPAETCNHCGSLISAPCTSAPAAAPQRCRPTPLAPNRPQRSKYSCTLAALLHTTAVCLRRPHSCQAPSALDLWQCNASPSARGYPYATTFAQLHARVKKRRPAPRSLAS